jgi:hypothetical protein
METPTSLEHLISLIHQELGPDKGLSHDSVNVDKIMYYMKSYQSNEQDWQQFALWYFSVFLFHIFFSKQTL